MCGDNPNCHCPKVGRKLTMNFEAVAYKIQKLDGEDYYVVPVVMARDDVVMNEAVFPEEEWLDIAWDGVPVTIRHPETPDGGFMSANSPQARERYWVGTLFNTKAETGKLKGEAWLSAKALKAKAPMIIDALNQGKNIDVSTGYFADVVPQDGTMNGRKFTARHTNVVPDHLALLPDQDGACSWADGCGVRANQQRSVVMKLKDALVAFVNATKLAKVKNADGTEPAPADPKQVIDALISMEGALFTEADRTGLQGLSIEALQALADKVCNEAPPMEGEPDGDEPPMTKSNAKKVDDKTADKPDPVVMTNADREALDHARRVAAAHRSSLVDKIVANSAITKEAAEAMTLSVLETIANGLTVLPTDYSGRATTAATQQANEAEVVAAMQSTGLLAHVKNAKKKD